MSRPLLLHLPVRNSSENSDLPLVLPSPVSPPSPAGVELRRHDLVIGIRWPLLGADGRQRPRGGVHAGAV